jgi:hypothetical protein
MITALKHRSIVLLFALAPAFASAQATDLLARGAAAWDEADPERWQFVDGEIHGSTAVFDGEKTDPAASAFLVGKDTVEGDFIVNIEVSFDRGRYLGVYLDYGQETRSGMWLATGHPLPPEAPDNEVERGYVKTVENGFWIVRATGELVIERGRRIKLGFSRRGDAYSLWNDGKLIAVYRREGGYPPGPLQLRLTNAAVRIHALTVRELSGRRSQ